MSEYHAIVLLIPVRYWWLLAHPMSGYYFGEES